MCKIPLLCRLPKGFVGECIFTLYNSHAGDGREGSHIALNLRKQRVLR
jgi:hypothetical protein